MSKAKKTSGSNTIYEKGLSSKERKAVNKRAEELMPDFSEKLPTDEEFDANVRGLENLGSMLDNWQKIALGGLLTDFTAENEYEAEKDIFKKLRNVALRCGMLGNKTLEAKFFNTIGDPKFIAISKAAGLGVIGLWLIPIAAKLVQMAMAGDKTAIKWVLEITGLKQSKFDFYMNRYQATHSNVERQYNINLGDHTDAELEKLLAGIEHDSEAEVARHPVGVDTA